MSLKIGDKVIFKRRYSMEFSAEENGTIVEIAYYKNMQGMARNINYIQPNDDVYFYSVSTKNFKWTCNIFIMDDIWLDTQGIREDRLLELGL